MLFSIGRELKDNVGDQLRGVRHLVRSLGAGQPPAGMATRPLPDMPAEIDRFVGRTFRAVDGVMTVVESVAAPFRPSRTGVAGFRRLDLHRPPAAGQAAAFTDDLYGVLKTVAAQAGQTPLILKGRLSGLHDALFVCTPGSDAAAGLDRAQLCARLFLLLARFRPLSAPHHADDEHAVLTQYAAVASVFGLQAFGAGDAADTARIAADALLLGGTRIDILQAAVDADVPGDALVRTFASFLAHLG